MSLADRLARGRTGPVCGICRRGRQLIYAPDHNRAWWIAWCPTCDTDPFQKPSSKDRP